MEQFAVHVDDACIAYWFDAGIGSEQLANHDKLRVKLCRSLSNSHI